MSNDTRIKLTLKFDGDNIGTYWFYLSTDDYFLYRSAMLAVENHGYLSSHINGKQFGEYHRAQGYRDYMVWATLPESADTTRFCHELLNRSNETLIDRYGRFVGIVAKDI